MTNENKFRVLVIDDNPNIHQDFRKILCNTMSLFSQREAKWSFEFEETEQDDRVTYDLECAIQGQNGVEMAKAALAEDRPYAVAFVDMRMPPGWDGLQTIEHLWRIDPEIQVVIVTAYTTYTREDIINRVGNTDKLIILKKPFEIIEIEQLAATLTKKWADTKKIAAKTAELERARAQLEQRAADLELSGEQKNKVLSELQNDILQPLNHVIELSRLLGENVNGNLADAELERINAIERHSNEILVLVNRFIEGGSQETV